MNSSHLLFSLQLESILKQRMTVTIVQHEWTREQYRSTISYMYEYFETESAFYIVR